VSVEAKGAAQRRRAGAHTASLGVLLCALSCSAGAVQTEFDVFRTERTVPATASGAVLGQTGICQFGGIEQPLSLRETIERTLCNNPKTREAWANVKVQAANVGINQGAYLPTVQGTWQGVRDDSVTDVTGQPQLSSASRSFVRSESLSLNWVLYDFGARSAALENANELFAAARANQDATLQTAFAQAAKDYYAAEAALGAVTTDKEVEDDAKDSFNAATERVNHGVAPITDALQAQTAYAQAVFSRAKAEGDLQTALGTLASDMALSPDTVITLPPVAGTITPDAQFDRSVTDLMDEAKRSHPSVVAAEAQVEAAAAKTRQTRDQGLPSFSFVSKYSLNNQPASLGLGVPTFPATGHDWYFGVQLTIPIFEGFVRNYQVRQAAAQTEVQQYTLVDRIPGAQDRHRERRQQRDLARYRAALGGCGAAPLSGGGREHPRVAERTIVAGNREEATYSIADRLALGAAATGRQARTFGYGAHCRRVGHARCGQQCARADALVDLNARAEHARSPCTNIWLQLKSKHSLICLLSK
jgi:outer membrane protein